MQSTGFQEQQPPVLGCLKLCCSRSQLCQAGGMQMGISAAQQSLGSIVAHLSHKLCSAGMNLPSCTAVAPQSTSQRLFDDKVHELDMRLLLCGVCSRWAQHTRPARQHAACHCRAAHLS